MGKSPIPKTDYVLYLLGYGRALEVFIVSTYLCVIPVETYTRGVGAGRTISKWTPHSLDREDHQDFVIRCQTYSTSLRDIGCDPRSLIELLIE